MVPMRNMTRIAKNIQPVKIMMKTATHAAYFCFSPNTALKIWPPSSWPAGRRLIDVISKPIQPANAIGFRSSANPCWIGANTVDKRAKSRELPRIVSPWPMVLIGIGFEVIRPMIVTGIATMNPARGPAIPTSNKVFLSGIGSWLDIKAPKVPILNPGSTGGIGMKNGNEVLR